MGRAGRMRIGVLWVFTVLQLTTASIAAADLSDCGQPVSGGPLPTATDCLFILRAAVGSETCVPECVCDIDGGDVVTATDALTCLKGAVGQAVTFDCDCSGVTTTLPPTTTSVPPGTTTTTLGLTTTTTDAVTSTTAPSTTTTLPATTTTTAAVTSTTLDPTTTTQSPTTSTLAPATTSSTTATSTSTTVTTTTSTSTTTTTSTTSTTLGDPCDPNPCLNGGDCFAFGPDDFHCFCFPDWTGPTCEQCGTPCSEDEEYYRDRFLSCVTDVDFCDRPYATCPEFCAGWMGCAGELYIDETYGTVEGEATCF